jgi:dipeptidyl aminopeptidase/acylaminoacyl peptidase
MPNRIPAIVFAGLLGTSVLSGQQPAATPSWDVTQPRGRTRQISFTATEGTWMSVDVSPDGQWLVFDLLASVYRMPIGGGAAQNLTAGSGIAVNFHPRISPDGRLIAYISDRKGQNNLWVMNPDGSSPRAVFTDNNVRAVQPAWTPDGNYIVVVRQLLPVGTAPAARASGCITATAATGSSWSRTSPALRGRRCRVTAAGSTSRSRPLSPAWSAAM